jgi:hypothetical protein
VVSKIFMSCIFERIKGPVEEKLRENQAGSRKGRSCFDMVFVLRRLIEESAVVQKSLFVNFVDFDKAFDCDYRDTLYGTC